MAQKELLNYIRDNCIKRGTYTLSSGIKSDMYIDIKKALTHPRYLYLISDLIMSEINSDVDAIAGMEFGALPIVFSCVSLSGCFQYGSLFGISIRKNDKEYGDKKRIIGLENLCEKSKICIVEDVMTTGNTVLRCIELLENEGHEIAQVISVIDRSQNQLVKINLKNYMYKSLFGINDVS